MKDILMAVLAAGAMSAAGAETQMPPLVPAADVCTKMPSPKIQGFTGSGKFHLVVFVRSGRIASAEIETILLKDMSRRDERAVKSSIMLAVRTYECKAEGDYNFEQILELSGAVAGN